MKTFDQIREDKGFIPHMMYDPKTGKGYKADKPEDHERMKKMGYTHDKPKTEDKPERKSTRESVVWEAIDPKMQKVKQLARLGLVNKMDITRLIRAMKSIETGERVAEKDRKVIFSAFGDLVDIITGDTTIFTKTRKAVQKEEVELDEGKFKDMVIRKQDKAMGAKPVPRPKKEARVIDPKAMSAYQKYAKAKRVDDDSIRMAYDNPDHPETKRMMKNPSFATALKMYKAAGKR